MLVTSDSDVQLIIPYNCKITHAVNNCSNAGEDT